MAMEEFKTGGLRDCVGKPKLALVPPQLEEAVAEVIWASSTEGGGKYPMHNWRKGLAYTQVCESAIRHLKSFMHGTHPGDIDPEGKLHHLKHAACNIAFLLYYVATGTGIDDRYKGEK